MLLQIGISDAPLSLGPLLLSRAVVECGVVSLVLFVAFMLFFLPHPARRGAAARHRGRLHRLVVGGHLGGTRR